MSQDHNDEIDLGVLLNKIGELWQRFLVFIYNCIRFVFKHWIVLLILIVAGAVGGHYWQKATPAVKATTLIIQNNFNSTHYVYNAVEILARKHRRGDIAFLKKHGFNEVSGSILEIEIAPIVNIIDLINKTDDVTGRSLEEYMTQTDFEEDVLLSEIFYSEYQYHRVYITTDGDANAEMIDQMIEYLNSNEILSQIQVVAMEETIQRIKGHEQSVKDIEGVFASYTSANNDIGGSQVTVKLAETNNLHLLLQEKKTIMEEIERLKSEVLKYEQVVTSINDPVLDYTFSFWDNKKVLLPIFLVFLYILVFAGLGFYKNIRSLAQGRAS